MTRLQLTSASDPKLAVGLRYGWRNWLALLDAHRPSKTAPAAPCSDAQAVALLKAFTEFCVLCAVREGPLGADLRVPPAIVDARFVEAALSGATAGEAP